MPAVSVVVPTHNRAPVLRRAIASALAPDVSRTSRSSSSMTPPTTTPRRPCARFNEPRIQYIRHAAGKGVAAARNTALRNAKGEYVAFLDDDDEWLPEKLQTQVDFCEASGPEVGGVHTARWTIQAATGERSPCCQSLCAIPTISERTGLRRRRCSCAGDASSRRVCSTKRCQPPATTTCGSASHNDSVWDTSAIRSSTTTSMAMACRTTSRRGFGGRRSCSAKHRAFFATSKIDDSRRYL